MVQLIRQELDSRLYATVCFVQMIQGIYVEILLVARAHGSLSDPKAVNALFLGRYDLRVLYL